MRTLNRVLTLLVVAVLTGGGAGVLLLSFSASNWRLLGYMLFASRLAGGCAGVAALCAGLLLLLSDGGLRRRDRFLSFSNDQGAVNISTEAISEYIGKLAPEFPSIVKMEPRVEPLFRRLDIVVDVRIKSGSQLHEICEVLQKRVRENMESGLGIRNVRKVVVRVRQISTEHKMT